MSEAQSILEYISQTYEITSKNGDPCHSFPLMTPRCSFASITPIAVEGRIQGQLQAEGVEFRLSGRYDRLDALEDGLELVDYKSSRHPKRPDPNLIDLQMGLYYLALEQRYRQCLKRISLLYLRTAEKLSFDVTMSHKQRVEAIIGKLALQLRADELWEPSLGAHCNCCSYTHYCPAIQDSPEPLPQMTRSPRQIQLALSF